MRLIQAALAAAMLLTWPATARAGTPDAVINAINSRGGQYAPCLMQIVRGETGNTFDPHVVNPYSSAYGAVQFLPYGGVYSVTPMGRAGVPVQSLSGPQQIDQAIWALSNGYKSAWQGYC